jgi:HAMP domain-containing protein
MLWALTVVLLVALALALLAVCGLFALFFGIAWLDALRRRGDGE